MATIDNVGRPAWMYDTATDKWYAISGRISTGSNYVWTGAHEWQNNSQFTGGLIATYKFNYFLNPAERASTVTSPHKGLLTFIEQDSVGNVINKFEYWNGSAWTSVNSLTETNQQSATSYTLSLSDRDKIVELNNSASITLTVPPNSSIAFPVGSSVTILQTGTGQVTVVGGSGVTVNANPGLKLSGQWAAATLVKRATDTWILLGNTTA